MEISKVLTWFIKRTLNFYSANNDFSVKQLIQVSNRRKGVETCVSIYQRQLQLII